MCLNAARLPARVDVSGKLTSLFDQDRSLWDRKLKADGIRLLELAATGCELTEYHLEAAIASVHARAARAEDTDWAAIVSLYDTLMLVRPSPVVALNRAIAIAQRDGPERGLEAIDAIEDRDRLAGSLLRNGVIMCGLKPEKGLRRRSEHDLCGISIPKAAAAGPRPPDGLRGGGRGRPHRASARESHLIVPLA